MIRSALFLALTAFGFSAMDASAAEVKVAYKGVVTQANGPQASSFAAGQEIRISYVVETTTADNNPSTSACVYFGGLRELQISIADAGVDVTTGPGIVQTFNDVGSDQAFFYNYNSGVSGELAGLPVSFAEVDFVDYGASAMLASDAIPTTHLLAASNYIAFNTSAGRTYFFFEAEADESVTTCASEGYKGTQLTWCKNICESNLSPAAHATWIHRWINRYRDLPYCAVEK